MEARVWVDGWQMQCCGDPFGVGSQVDWTVAPVDREFLGVLLGEAEAARLTHAEEHHAGPGGPRPGLGRLSGTVRAVGAVFCRYARTDPDANSLYPVAGSAVVEPRSSVTGWESERGDVSFVGYVVDLKGA